MSIALYRKWRPSTWEDVVGQDHVIQTLRNAVSNDRLAHAYLFAGPRGTGKTSTARLLAKAANCLAPELGDRPDDQCEVCLAINQGRFLDLIEIDAASNTSVEDVRDLRDKINFSPNEGRYKVYIIDEVHMLSAAAFNALLKTLEEPPAHAIFILATTEVHKVPATVLSRCQRHEFRLIPVRTITDYLSMLVKEEGLKAEPGALETIARQATGSLRDGVSLLDQLASMGEKITPEMARLVLGSATQEIVLDLVDTLVNENPSAGLSLLNQAMDAGSDPRQLGRQVVDHLRNLLLIEMGNKDLVDETEERVEQMQVQAHGLGVNGITQAIQHFGEAVAGGRASWLPGLPLELALIQSMRGSIQRADPSPAAGVDTAEQPEQSTPPMPPSESASKQPERTATPAPLDPHQGEGLSFRQITGRWAEILSAAYKVDPRTQALLNSCKPMGFEKGSLVLGFSSDLLREKMEKGHNLSIVSGALKEVFDSQVGIRCVLADRWHGRGQSDDLPVEDGGIVATAMQDLGAQVVDVKRLPPDS